MSKESFQPAECDIVMEGGITSGVVYPSFIVQLATKFRLRSIGGTSVGAVAAVAAAAAQFRRNRSRAGVSDKDGNMVSDSGFAKLDELPQWLQKSSSMGKSNLFSLFQPCSALRRHFNLLEIMLNRASVGSRVIRVMLFLPLLFPIGAIVGAALFSTLWVDAALAYWRWAFAAIWLLVAMEAGAAAEFVVTGWWGLRRNRCGICSGLRTDAHNPPALTEWLHSFVQEIAGLPDQEPLTFGKLSEDTQKIDLRFISTGISELCSHQLPYDTHGLVFRKSELQHLLQDSLLKWLIAHSASVREKTDETSRTEILLREFNNEIGVSEPDYFAMPDPADLPVVIAARMSLSFPILLQAIPLYRVRFVPGPNGENGKVTLARVWFSDGGLTSNFPIHFFDALLPSRPTFGVTLSNTLTEDAEFNSRIYLPDNNLGNANASYLPIDEDSLPSIWPFFGALINTMRTWQDEALKRSPGYRDRIVLIRHKREEGGLNLNMPSAAIDVMSASGKAAAEKIISTFLSPGPENNAWLGHRWVRMRIAAQVLQTGLIPVASRLSDTSCDPSYEVMWNTNPANRPKSYVLNADQRRVGAEFFSALVAASNTAGSVSLEVGSPAPYPKLVVQPKPS